ncbi:MAG TPA: hypothetical protein VID30_06365 [Bradyrhizobium sp.]|jgi:hypothetical protein
MSKEQVKAILDPVMTWPAERQEDAAKILVLMEAQDDSNYRPTDEQVAEVQRRIADPNRRFLTLEEADERAPCTPTGVGSNIVAFAEAVVELQERRLPLTTT